MSKSLNKSLNKKSKKYGTKTIYDEYNSNN